MGISRKTLIAVAAVLAVVLVPHLLGVLAFIIAVAAALAVLLALHALAVAFTVTLGAVVVLAWRIDLLTMATGWGIIPCREPAA